jgi:transmembrane sensor
MIDYKEIPNNSFWELATKVACGESTQEEFLAFNAILEGNKNVEKKYAIVKEIIDQSAEIPHIEAENLEKDWVYIENYINKSKIKSKKGNYTLSLNWMKYAASIILLIGLGFYMSLMYTKRKHDNKPMYYTIKAPMGSRSDVLLADSTIIVLNAGSLIRIASDYNINNRNIYLEGEAYFNVKKSDIPLILTTNDIKVNVLGTVFNVKSYPTENTVETTLLSGSLIVESIGNTQKRTIKLSPNQKIVLNKTSQNLTLYSVSENGSVKNVSEGLVKYEDISKITLDSDRQIKQSVSWKDGIFVMNGENLGELAEIIERRFDIEIEFTNDSIKNYRISGIIKEVSLEQLLNGLKAVAPINYSIEHKKVLIEGDQLTQKKFIDSTR